MKNIAIIIPSLKFGWGAEKIAATLWTEFSHCWYQIHYITFYDADTKYPHDGVEVCLHEKPSHNPIVNIYKLFRRARRIAKIIKQYDSDTSLSLMEEANFSTILSQLRGNTSKILIAIRHSLSDYSRWLYYRLIRILYRYAYNIIVLTQVEKKNLIQKFSIKPENICIIHNAVDTDKINQLKTEDLWPYSKYFTSWVFTFISVGRLVAIKNQELLITTFLKFNEAYPDTQLLILWEWPLREHLQQIIGDSLSIHLLWNQANPYKFLARADCFVLTSVSEAFPNVILEAMQCGLPIIASDTQWAQEILRWWNGIIYSTVNELKKNMIDMLSHQNLKKEYNKKSLSRAWDFEIKNIMKDREEIIT